MRAIEVRRTLVYKKTHPGDPENGCFGSQDCMGSVRARTFDAVIGVGGNGAEARSHNIHGKIDWVGLGPKKHPAPGYRGPIVTFDHIKDFSGKGPELRKIAPRLAARMYDGNPRTVMAFSAEEQVELKGILRLADGGPSSHQHGARTAKACSARARACDPRRRGTLRSG
jgi:hypothetical protein